MREFCNAIDLFHISDIQSVSGSVITLKPGRNFVTLEASSELTLEPKEETSDAGILYNIQENITIEKVPDNIKHQYHTLQSVILQVHTTDSGKITLGSLEYPARVSITAHLQHDKLNLALKTPESPF